MDFNHPSNILSPPPLQVVKMKKSASMQEFKRSPTQLGRKFSIGTATENGSSDITPRATNSHHTISGKSSSYSILRTQTPRLLTKLRSFSNGRVSTSRATCRRYSVGIREPSAESAASLQPRRMPSSQNGISNFGSSSSEGSYDPDPAMPLGFGFNAHGPRSASSSLPYIHESDNPLLDPSLLIPQIRVIPEMTTLGDGNAIV